MKTILHLGVLLFSSLFLLPAANGQPRQSVDQTQFPAEFVPSGKQMFIEYCAACHGADAKGHGPARAALKVPAANLTTLAKRHGGKFPYEYVTRVLQFGPGFASHGSSVMPTWGPIFRYMDNYNRTVVDKRIQNLCDYLNSIQVK